MAEVLEEKAESQENTEESQAGEPTEEELAAVEDLSDEELNKRIKELEARQ